MICRDFEYIREERKKAMLKVYYQVINWSEVEIGDYCNTMNG